jgi:uncharacterized membrane protein YphA (DoxX/SURF4 family)
MQGIGVPFPVFFSWLVAVLEFCGGMALLLGFFVSAVAFLIVIEMVINLAAAVLHGGFPPPLNPSQPLPGYEQSLLYLAGAVALTLGGAGGVSITRLFVPRPVA